MTTRPTYGPHNRHPLSQMRTELVWEGKYDEYGRPREVDSGGLAMPLQRTETIDQPRSEAAAAGQLAMFDKQAVRPRLGATASSGATTSWSWRRC